ncbi:hypothetical protein [Chromobacterium amazonense]|uniref:hypothetical protein n=1 Tax=Chromobacterium amazonense TaxID=1382803 RepID=UPI003F7A1EC4
MNRIAALLTLTSTLTVAMPTQNTPLLLFGDSGHHTFLGCLNCGKFDTNSVCNQFGPHGSPYATESIWNQYGTYGSRYSSQSPWNKYASDPPVVVDNNGNFYGYLTANQYKGQRTQISALVTLTDVVVRGEDPSSVADRLCDR